MIESICGMEVRESLHAVTMKQAREHERRPGQSDSYHKRIMKKWLKRFGMRAIPCMYKIGPQIAGREVIMVHPDLMPKLRAAMHKPAAPNGEC